MAQSVSQSWHATPTCFLKLIMMNAEIKGGPVFAMVNKTSMETEAHARLGLLVIGAMWMRKLAVTTKILMMENLFLYHRAMVEQQPTVPGVRGVAGAAALPPVEVGHNMLQDRWQSRQQMEGSCVRGNL